MIGHLNVSVSFTASRFVLVYRGRSYFVGVGARGSSSNSVERIGTRLRDELSSLEVLRIYDCAMFDGLHRDLCLYNFPYAHFGRTCSTSHRIAHGRDCLVTRSV